MEQKREKPDQEILEKFLNLVDETGISSHEFGLISNEVSNKLVRKKFK
jgi:hypothetical protein